MGKIIPTTINRFDGGIVQDPRDSREDVCRMISNFDILTESKRMIPTRSSIDGDSASATSKKQNFAIALRTGTTYRVYSLGVKSGAATAEVLMKDLAVTGSAGDLNDSSWLTPANNQSSSGATVFSLFTYYAKTALIYGAKTNTIWAFDPTSVSAFDDSARSITFTNIAEGLVHSKDDILYIPYDNKILKNNNGSWTDVAITIPSHFRITSIAEFGNYLVIAASPLSGVGNSVVYLWDRDTSLETLSENIQWGKGIIQAIETVDGRLIGISSSGTNELRIAPKVTFRHLVGNRARTFLEIDSGSAFQVISAKQVIDNRLYFMMAATINGTFRQGLWSVGWSNVAQGFTLAMEKTCENDTAIDNSSLALKSFIIIGDYAIQAYIDGTPDFAVSITTNSTSATSTYESKIFVAYSGKDKSITKKLTSVTVLTDSKTGTGVAVSYKIEGESSYTTIFATKPNDSTSHTATNIESSGAILPEYKEIEFRIESSGIGITGFKFKSELIDSDID